MRYNEFNESRPGDLDRFEEIQEYAEDNCWPFLDEIGSWYSMIGSRRFMYRGMAEGWEKPMAVHDVHLNDRQPLNTSRKMHGLVNDYFTRAYGSPFRNSVMCTGDDGVAEDYGDLRIVLPVGQFKYLWSPHVEDMTMDMSRLLPRGITEQEIDQEFIDQMFSKLGYRIDGLAEAIKSNNEIMIRCKQYISVDPEILLQ